MEQYRRIVCLLLCFLLPNSFCMRALAEESFEEIPEEIWVEVSEEIWEETWDNPEEETEKEELTEDVFTEKEVWEDIVPEESPAIYNTGVPLYLQTDYPHIYYGESTVAVSGCSITSLAMVATYLTGHEYLPDELARYFAYSGESHMARLEYGSDVLKLPYEKNTNWHTTLQALQEGKLAIVLLSGASHFTQSQHFVVLTGLTGEGRILVNDPYAPNYEHWALQQGFREGFTEDAIVCGFQGAWVYDPDAMPETVEEYYEERPEPVNLEDIPLYFQNDYPNTRYADGTVATSGCSVTSLAMVASYLTNHPYQPDELARYFGGRAENHMARIELGSETLGLPYEKNTNWHTTLQALREGKVAIILVDDQTPFTQSQHFLVLTGLTSDGKVQVHDSWEPNYSHWALKEGFISGFDPEMMMKGFQGAWVYDKSLMPEDPGIYYNPEPLRGESRYKGVELTLEEEDLLAKVIWAEARGESPEGQQAVAEVVLNRLVSEDFANTLEAVIYGEGQFRSVPYLKDADPWQAQYEAIEAALYGPSILPMDVFYFARWETNPNVWGQIGRHIFCFAE